MNSHPVPDFLRQHGITQVNEHIAPHERLDVGKDLALFYAEDLATAIAENPDLLKRKEAADDR